MTKLGEGYKGVWPEHPVENPQEGDTVRYPQAGRWELSEDRE